MSLAAALALATAYGLFGARGSVATAQNAGPLQGLGSITGTVTAPSAFKAARVYLRNTDKNIMYMVYTSAGAFRAVAMLPGNYELTVKGRGLESAAQKLVVKAGVNPAVKVGMQAADNPDKYPTWVDPS
ncbi:MAG: carboxypeptidase-like regulatory domain-containing protein, partial [Vicinamibacterales bacterium]